MKAVLKFIWSIISHRLFILCIIILGMFYVLFSRIFELQIVQGEKLEKEFNLSILKERELEGQRGNIYDRNGYPLAENVIAYNVQLDGSIRVENINQMIYELCEIIGKSGNEMVEILPITLNEDGNFAFTQTDSQVLKFKKNIFLGIGKDDLTSQQLAMSANDVFVYLRDELFQIPTEMYAQEDILSILNIRYPLWLNRYTQYELNTIAIDINTETLARIEENIGKFPGVSIVEDPLRKYNDSNYFAHIIGYTGLIDSETLIALEAQGYEATDVVGKIGVEKQMEVFLRGKAGKQTVEVDSLGRTMSILSTVEPTVGKDVYLTLDRDLQINCYHLLEQKLAYLLQNTLSMRGSNKPDKDDGVTLMKDVFSSIWNNEILSIKQVEEALDDTRQHSLYTTFLDGKMDLTNRLEYMLSNNSVIPTEDELDIIKMLLEEMNKESYLLEGYQNTELYTKLLNREATFKQLLEDYVALKLIAIPKSELKEQTPFDALKRLILERFVNYFNIKKQIYTQLAQSESFSYTDLCLSLVEQGVVKATEDQIKSLKNGRLSSVTFMKEKITNLEITPQQLALDPFSGSVVVTDVNTGELLAMVSYPSYDNNRLVNDFDYAYYLELLDDPTTPLFPRATQSKYAPGSTFKMVAAIAALEEGVIGPNEYFSCQGYYQKIFPAAKCWIYEYGSTHGALTISSALEVSCNYFYYEMGYRLSMNDDGSMSDIKGINKLNEYSQLLGLGAKTGIEIGDVDATLPTQDAVRTSIGQSANSYSPVQLSRYVATLANGGTSYEINIIDKVLENNGDVFFEKTPAIPFQNDFAPENVEAIQQGMLLVTSGSRGTARGIFAGFPIKVAGKTGTAQQAKNRPDHGIFVGYAPFSKPEIAVSVVIPFGYGSYIPTVLGREVIGNYYELGDLKEGEKTTYYHMLDE